MSGYTVVLICILLAICALIKYRNIINPIFVFSAIFGFSVWLSTLGIDQVAVPERKTFLIVGLGVIFFAIGGFLSDSKIVIKTPFSNKNSNSLCAINLTRLRIITVIGIASSVIELRNTIRVFRSGGLIGVYTQRLAVQFDGADNLMRKNFFESVNNQFIFQPVMYFLLVAFLILYFEKKEKKFFIFSIITLLAILISNGGRTVVLLFIIYYIVLFLELRKERVLAVTISKEKLKYIVGGFIAVIVLFYVFSSRGTNVISTIGSYFGYPIIHMQYKLHSAEQYFYTNGMASFQGLLRPIINIFEIITGYDSEILNVTGQVSNIANSAYRLTSSVYYNAFVTPFYYFYCDGGLVGVSLLSLLFGWFSNRLYINHISNRNNRTILLFMLSFGLPICFSFVRFQYALSTIPWAMIICLWVTNERRIKE